MSAASSRGPRVAANKSDTKNVLRGCWSADHLACRIGTLEPWILESARPDEIRAGFPPNERAGSAFHSNRFFLESARLVSRRVRATRGAPFRTHGTRIRASTPQKEPFRDVRRARPDLGRPPRGHAPAHVAPGSMSTRGGPLPPPPRGLLRGGGARHEGVLSRDVQHPRRHQGDEVPRRRRSGEEDRHHQRQGVRRGDVRRRRGVQVGDRGGQVATGWQVPQGAARAARAKRGRRDFLERAR